MHAFDMLHDERLIDNSHVKNREEEEEVKEENKSGIMDASQIYGKKPTRQIRPTNRATATSNGSNGLHVQPQPKPQHIRLVLL